MSEFSLIDRYCQNIGVSHQATSIDVGDDAAVIQIPSNKELAISVDTMVEGVHFFPNVSAENLAHKIAAVNLSDMAAMGAEPKWATLALSLPKINENWLAAFSMSLNRVLTHYGVQLIGGDTTQGSLTLTMQIMGLVDKGEALTREGAQLGDVLYVSGQLGDAALALAVLKGEIDQGEMDRQHLLSCLEKPIPQVALGLEIAGFASSCIDISDGLVADIQHIAKASDIAISLDVERLPLSTSYAHYLDVGGNLDLALSGGDDYQLAFTANPMHQTTLEKISSELGVELTDIGKIVAKHDDISSSGSDHLLQLSFNGKPYALDRDLGYQHFKGA